MKPYTSKILKELRKKHNKTQLEVAEFLGISRQAYSRYESSSREPDMETLSNIALFYKVSPQVFYIDDMDKHLDPDMDIVEMVARYQLKSTIYQDSDKSEGSDLNYDLSKKDKEQLQSALSKHFGLEEKHFDSKEKHFVINESSDLEEKQSDSNESNESEEKQLGKGAKPKKQKSLRKKIIQFGFLILIILFIVNIGIMTIHRRDSNYQYSIFSHSYINAVAPEQNVNRTMYLDIVRIYEFNPDNIEIGDYVVIYSDFGLSEYFIEKVTQINDDDQTITTTYDNLTATTNQFTDVVGVYEKEANILGTIYYASKFNTGYLLLVLAHIIVLAIYYLSFFDKQKDYNN